MKKRGISYTEVLVSVALFSVGLIPLIGAFNSSYKAMNYNRDLGLALEYNQQMIEEIGSLLPLEVTNDVYENLSIEDGSSNLEADIRELIEARSEHNVKGIYSMINWEGDKFNFNRENLETNVYYREIKVGEVQDENNGVYPRNGIDNPEDRNEEDAIILPVTITAIKVSDSSEIVSSKLKIRLNKIEDGVVEDDEPIEDTPEPIYGMIDEGTTSNINPGSKNTVNTPTHIVSLNTTVNGNYIKLTYESNKNGMSRTSKVEVQINGGSWKETIRKSKEERKHIYEIYETIPAGANLNIRITFDKSGNNGGKLTESYEIWNSRN